jgi:cell division protein ZipA
VDIKDFILIGGGVLIAAVVAHGFWIAWRERRQDLRIDIKPDLIPDEVDEIDRLRGELPNGGARLAKSDPLQVDLELDDPPPLLLEPTTGPPPYGKRIEPELNAERQPAAADPEQDVGAAIEVESIDDSDYVLPGRTPVSQPSSDKTEHTDPRTAPTTTAKVAEVAMPAEATKPEPIVAEQPKRPRRLGQRKNVERAAVRDVGETTTGKPVEELIVINVLSEPDAPFTGDALFTVLRTCGLKFGDMSIFHRIEPLTKVVQYSVANAMEPGTFDMAEMETARFYGLCLFMQLPGPEKAGVAFEEMLTVAGAVTKSLGGEVKDEHHNVMTLQSTEHYRQRIVDFSRRRMSKRA